MGTQTSKTWTCGITTVEERIKNGLLVKTLRHLHHGGFPEPRIFIDGPCELPDWLCEFEVTQRLPKVRCAGNWILAAWELFIRSPWSDYFALFQDDIKCCQHLREYLEQIVYPAQGYLNLYTHPHDKKNFKGRFYLSRQKGKGALALVFSNQAMKTVLGAKHLVNRTPDPVRGHKLIDGGIVDSFKEQGWREYVHNPTLVEHMGDKSTVSGGRHPKGYNFPGTQFDAREFLVTPENRKAVPEVQSNIKTCKDALNHMISPGTRRPTKARGGVIQIMVCRACDKQCFGCTQGAQLKGGAKFISPESFETACRSLKDYYGVVGIFGGNPCLHPKFEQLCKILTQYIPKERRGIWTNNLNGHGPLVRETFTPSISNINVHLDKRAANEFRREWPGVKVHGENNESRHAPPFVAMKDLLEPWEYWPLVPQCDIHRFWSSIICEVQGEPRAYFCEIAGAQAMLHENDPNWPQLGLPVTPDWWRKDIRDFESQVGFYCPRCGVPLRIKGALSQGPGVEQVTETHKDIFQPKDSQRMVTVIKDRKKLEFQDKKVTKYLT